MRAKPSLLGKDEVASSNLASSSKRKPIRTGWAFFWIYGVRELAASSDLTAQAVSISIRGREASMKSWISWSRVASSNLASSSKPSEIFGFQRFFFAVAGNRQLKVQNRKFCVKSQTASLFAIF